MVYRMTIKLFFHINNNNAIGNTGFLIETSRAAHEKITVYDGDKEIHLLVLFVVFVASESVYQRIKHAVHKTLSIKLLVVITSENKIIYFIYT